MKRTFSPRSVTRSIMSLFGVKKTLSTYKRHPDDYWKQHWLTKSHDEALDYLSKERRMSKKRFTDEIIERGIANYLEENIAEYNRQAIAFREQGQDPKATHFIRMMRRWARDKGFDINKFL